MVTFVKLMHHSCFNHKGKSIARVKYDFHMHKRSGAAARCSVDSSCSVKQHINALFISIINASIKKRRKEKYI